MKRGIVIIAFSLVFLNGKAQTGIGTATPHTSAKLEVAATNKGFLPPRISLTGVYDQTTIPNPVTGLLVYCNGNAGLSAGYYFWNGNAWATIATAGGSGSVAAVFGENILSTNVTVSSTTPVDVLTFTLPSAGTWEVITFMRAQGIPSFAAEFALYDAANVVVSNSEILAAYGENASTGTGIFRITTTGLAVYKVKAWASHGSFNATTDNNGRTGVTWKKISGNSAMTVINFGGIKTGMQANDHNGWVRLNGRLKSSLSATQQAQANLLGIGANLPNASNAFLVQNGTALGSVSGRNTITIARANLPNVTLSGTTSTDGLHTHNFTRPRGDQNYSNGSGNTWWGGSSGITVTTNSEGSHSHTFTTSSINGGVTQTSLDITPQSLSVNTFI